MTTDIIDILKEPKMTTVCAPMVRYSKLQFRTLVRKYNCDLCFTPMIMADAFLQSLQARNIDFTINKVDQPLIAQFAAKTTHDFVDAAELVSPYANGIDLNCGCPQRWAMKDGYGAHLLQKPHLVKDLVYQVRNRISQPFTVSVKIRLQKEIQKTVEFCRIMEKAGASFITVHARTVDMRNEPINLGNLKIVRQSVQIPVISNGGVKSLDDANKLYEESGCNGIMSAGGLLTNPALFSGCNVTPLSCVQEWLDITSVAPTHFMCFHHHLVFMLEKVLPKPEKQVFNNLQSKESVLNYIEQYFGITPNDENSLYAPIACEYDCLPKKSVKKRQNSFCDDDEGDTSLTDLFFMP